MADHQSLLTLVKQRKTTPVLFWSAIGVGALIVLAAIGVAITRLRETYGDWSDVVLGSSSTFLFLGISLFFTVLALSFVTFVVKPKQWIPYAIVATVGIQTFIATPIDLSPLKDAESPDDSTKVSVNSAFGFAEPLVTKRMDRLVERKRRDERNAFVASYTKKGTAGKQQLLRGLDNAVDDETEVSGREAKDKLKAELRKIVTDRATRSDYNLRLDAVVTNLYDAGLRDIVQDLTTTK